MHGATRSGGVSIPRSGFCLFILVDRQCEFRHSGSFNPSVGILFVHTRRRCAEFVFRFRFQSLGRDSVCSYYGEPVDLSEVVDVSIPRSGFCLFILCHHDRSKNDVGGFNPSVGILFVHTKTRSRNAPNSVTVSIPRSGFCLFIPGFAYHAGGNYQVSFRTFVLYPMLP